MDRAVFDAALRFRLGSVIPSPQVTALYGFGNVEEEDEIVRCFGRMSSEFFRRRR